MDKKILTARELSEHFEVSVRTIHRDLDVLSEAGIPIYTMQGKGGGISLLGNYTLDRSLLTDEEQTDILMALQSLSSMDFPDANVVLERLGSLFRKEDSGWLEVDFSPWGSDVENKEKFNLLKYAIVHHRVITFDYYNSKGEKSSRRAEPVKLLFKYNAWYFTAYCCARNAYRTFKVSRMREFHVTEQAFLLREPAKEIPDASEELLKDTINVQLRVSSSGAYRVYDDFPNDKITLNPDGSFTVNGSFPNDEALYAYLLSYGSTLAGVSPDTVKNHLIEKLSSMTEKLDVHE